jgi:hypothetical protein
MEVIEKLKWKCIPHPSPYKVSRLHKCYQIIVSEQCLLKFQLGGYGVQLLCDVVAMDVCHVLLGRPWMYDIKSCHNGVKSTYQFVKDGMSFKLLPMLEGSTERRIVMSFDKESLREESYILHNCIVMLMKKERIMYLRKFRYNYSYNIRICRCLEAMKMKTR